MLDLLLLVEVGWKQPSPGLARHLDCGAAPAKLKTVRQFFTISNSGSQSYVKMSNEYSNKNTGGKMQNLKLKMSNRLDPRAMNEAMTGMIYLCAHDHRSTCR